MAVIANTITANNTSEDASRVFSATLANGDSTAPLQSSGSFDRSVQLTGTFGVGGTVVIEGSNDAGANWFTLRDPQGVSLSFTAAGLKAVLESVGLMRARVSAGDGTTSVVVSTFARRNFR